MTTLPVREMVLYKHGVGFFVRQGDVDGTEATLTFRAEEVNDILKSLAVFDRAGGQVYGVHYQTPMDRAHRLANTSIRLGNDTSITQLLQQLRGRTVMLVIADDKNKEFSYTGRIIGTDRQRDLDGGEQWFVSLLTSDGASNIFPFDKIKQFTIRDEQSKQDLTYFLDTSMSEDNRRSVTVRMSEGAHELVVHYVAPSPTWRVSYRLVAESDDNEATGKALLQGWGLFDNRLEEDLEDVKVTLVAGQPISFIYDLYESKIPERPLIKDEARVVDAPIEYRAEKPAPKPAAPASLRRKAPASTASMAFADMAPIESEAYGMDMESLEQSTAISAEGKESGETFQYSVTTPVTVKRGESALVPILGQTLNYERELLYNRDKLPDHPVASLRFENQTGLTLERGPVTVVEDGDYKGEAIIPFTKDKSAVYVPYAVELGVTIKEGQKSANELRGIAITNDYLQRQEYVIIETTYTIDNTTDKEKVVTIEATKNTDWELFDTPDPDAETLNERRWKVTCATDVLTTFVRKERKMQWQSRNIRKMQYIELDRYLENRFIDNALVDELREILDAVQAVRDMNTQILKLKEEQQVIYSKQEQLRKNMGSLGSTGKEGTLRQRVVDQLEASQDRLEMTESDIAEMQTEIEATKQRIDEMIATLSARYADD